MKWFYELGYRYFHMPWDGGPRQDLVKLVEGGRIPPSRAIDLGCGTGSNAIFLAQHGFDVTGVDYSSAAIEKARERAMAAGAPVKFVADDLTHLRHVTGPYDLLVDYGVLDDLRPKNRDLSVQNVLPLAHPGTRYLLYTWEWPMRWWERATFAAALEPGEVERRFGEYFEIEPLVRKTGLSGWPHGFAVYLMTRNRDDYPRN